MVKVKVCGITNLEDAQAAIDCGADALGFVFAPSPRRVTLQVAREIIAQLPPFVCKVGVFVNSELSEVLRTLELCPLNLAQLHGDEDPCYCGALFPRTIKVFTFSALGDLSQLKRYRVGAYMLDRDKSGSVKAPEVSQWKLAREAGRYGRVILAGGLTPENVSQAIRTAQPYAVDVASGVEHSPGKKDREKLRAFLKAVKQAHQRVPF